MSSRFGVQVVSLDRGGCVQPGFHMNLESISTGLLHWPVRPALQYSIVGFDHTPELIDVVTRMVNIGAFADSGTTFFSGELPVDDEHPLNMLEGCFLVAQVREGRWQLTRKGMQSLLHLEVLG
jgi:hypothetical protein